MMYGYDRYGGYGYRMMSGGGWVLMLILGLLILAAIVYFAVHLANQSRDRNNYQENAYRGRQVFHHEHRQADNSTQILNERLAKGEITHEEYERIKATLTNPL